MEKLDFVDTHVHYYDMKHPELFYGHWQPGVPHPFLGWQIQKLAKRNYLAEDYIADTRKSKVSKAIHVQAAIGTEDPVKETEWLQNTAGRTGFPHAIVAHADLRHPNVDVVLDKHCEFDNIRGIRDFSYGDYLVEPDFRRGLALLDKYNLISSVSVQWQEMGKLRDLAGKLPNINIVLDHAGFPVERSQEYFENWKHSLVTVASAENVWIKISGLGMGDNNWTVDSIRPYVLHCIETFGTNRSFFGTNWPIDSLWSTYDAVVDAYTEIISDFSKGEQIAMFSRNAQDLYRI